MPAHLPESHVSDVDVSVGPTQARFVQDLPQFLPLPDSRANYLRICAELADLRRRVEALERPWWIKLRDWLKGWIRT